MRIFFIFCLILGLGWAANLNAPLQGAHTIRQSDTVFAAYSYCTEDTDFFHPKVAHRGNTSGVAIGEFPLYSYVLSLPCRIRGSWSEWDPKFFTLLLWILNLLVWTRWSRGYLRELNLLPSAFPLVLGFSTFSLLFMTVSLPDNLAFLFVGIAALLAQRKTGRWGPLAEGALFVVAFAMRPYLIPLAVLVRGDRKWLLATGAACVLAYGLWYKWWAPHSDLNYYYIAIPPFSEMLGQLPHYALPLAETILREWYQYIFAVLILWKWRFLKRIEILALIFSLALVIVVRGEHLVVHSYYLWAAAFFGFLCLLRALAAFPPRAQFYFVVAFAIFGIAQTQHQFHRQAEARSEKIRELLRSENVPPQAKIAVYVGEGSCSTHYLYWMKHVGWCIYEKEFRGPAACPTGADYYFLYEKDEPILRPCSAAPTETPIDK